MGTLTFVCHWNRGLNRHWNGPSDT